VRRQGVAFAVHTAVRVRGLELLSGRLGNLLTQEAEEGVADGKTVMSCAIRNLWIGFPLGLVSDALGNLGRLDGIDEPLENFIKSSH
jgi:hypothetical protein